MHQPRSDADTTTLAISLLVLLLVFAALAIGLIAGRGPIKGSCGGIAAMTREDCPICGGNPAKCDSADPAGLAEDVSRRPSAPEIGER
ncbi:MAG: (Na+)-NQR maturation NqrM [Gammaproteobacteria bacterium]